MKPRMASSQLCLSLKSSIARTRACASRVASVAPRGTLSACATNAVPAVSTAARAAVTNFLMPILLFAPSASGFHGEKARCNFQLLPRA